MENPANHSINFLDLFG